MVWLVGRGVKKSPVGKRRGFRKATVKALFDEVGKEHAVDHYSGNKEHGFNDVCITLIPLCVEAAALYITFDFLEDVFAGSLIGSGVHLFVDYSESKSLE